MNNNTQQLENAKVIKQAAIELVKKNTSFSSDVVIGAFAGCVARFLVAPLDVLKIRFQLQSSIGSRQYGSMFSSSRQIIAEEGVRALWKGTLTSLYMIAPYTAATFAVNQWMKAAFLGQNTRPAPWFSLISGATAGVVGSVVIYPLDLMRTRLAAQHGTKGYSSFKIAFKDMSSGPRGVLGLYQGLTPAVIGIIPYMGVQFAMYDLNREILGKYAYLIDHALCNISRSIDTVYRTIGMPHLSTLTCKALGLTYWHDRAYDDISSEAVVYETGAQPMWVAPIAGVVAGASGKFVSYPFDVIKKYHQVHNFKFNMFSDASSQRAISPSIKDFVKEIYQTDGMRGFFKGITPAVLKTAASSGLVFALFELSHCLLSPFTRSKTPKSL